MSQRTLHTHANRRYRAGARLALLATLTVGMAASALVGSRAPSAGISHQQGPKPAPSALDGAPLGPAPLGPAPLEPAIEPASLPVPAVNRNEPAASLQLDRAVDFAPAAAPAVERLVL